MCCIQSFTDIRRLSRCIGCLVSFILISAWFSSSYWVTACISLACRMLLLSEWATCIGLHVSRTRLYSVWPFCLYVLKFSSQHLSVYDVRASPSVTMLTGRCELKENMKYWLLVCVLLLLGDDHALNFGTAVFLMFGDVNRKCKATLSIYLTNCHHLVGLAVSSSCSCLQDTHACADTYHWITSILTKLYDFLIKKKRFVADLWTFICSCSVSVSVNHIESKNNYIMSDLTAATCFMFLLMVLLCKASWSLHIFHSVVQDSVWIIDFESLSYT